MTKTLVSKIIFKPKLKWFSKNLLLNDFKLLSKMFDTEDYSITLKNNIPIVGHELTDYLSKSEQKLSKFFKCCPKESFGLNGKCFWSANNVHKFKDHIQSTHESVFCCYCLSDNPSKVETLESFTAEDVDRLINHMTESHGQRVFQCNRCQYRANTSTHIQLHQMSAHYHIW